MIEDKGGKADSLSSASSLSQPLLSSYSSILSSNLPKLPNASTFYTRNVTLAKVCVMLTVIFERCAYYSFYGNMALFVNYHLGWTATQAAAVVLAFSGLTWLSCFVGGIISDCWLGRFKTISTGLVLYALGLGLLPLLAHITDKGEGTKVYAVVWFALILLIISMGEGLFKSNMSPFGADQLSMAQNEEMRSFFNYFYWSINIGSFLGFGPMTLLQQQKDFIIGYGASVACIVAAGLIFFIPRRRNYHVCQPVTNVLKKIIFICHNARRSKTPAPQTGSRASLNNRAFPNPTGYEEFVPVQHWLDWAMVKYGGAYLDSEVQEVKMLFHVLPVFGFLIIYCACYFQLSGTFVLQGLHMNLYHLYKNVPIPVAWLSLFNIAFVIVFVPIVDRLLYPCLEKSGRKVPMMLRMSIGMVLGSASMVSAGVVEIYRLRTNGTVHNLVNNVTIPGKDVSLFLQVPQYGLMGLSEIFVLITGLEFAYCQAPKSMQSLVTGVFFVANGAGAFLGALIIYVGDTWCKANFLPKDHEEKHGDRYDPRLDGRLHVFFFLLAGLNLLNWLAFLLFNARRNTLRRRKDLDQTVAAYMRGSMMASVERSQGK